MKNIKVLSAVTAEIEKTQGGYTFEFGALWDVENEPAKNFVQEIEYKFGNKAKTYGFLQETSGSETVPNILKGFTRGPLTNFKDMSSRMMARLRRALKAQGRGNTSMGHIVFMHYLNDEEIQGVGRLMIVMVDKKDVFDFSESLVPTQFKSIDTDKLRQAVLYDLELFDAVYPDGIDDAQERAYLWFISGSSKGGFFKEAFGTSTVIENNVSVNNVFSAIEGFAEKLGLRPTQVGLLKECVEDLISEKGGKQISVASISRCVKNNLPASLDVKDDDFTDYINSSGFKISEIFDVTDSQLKKVSNIEGNKGQEYSYRVKKSVIASVEEKGRGVRYDTAKRMLYLEVVDDKVHAEFIKAIEENKQESLSL